MQEHVTNQGLYGVREIIGKQHCYDLIKIGLFVFIFTKHYQCRAIAFLFYLKHNIQKLRRRNVFL